nr:PREDICTED: C-type lectin domain family 4 member A [Rhinolophus sinicus]
MTSEITYAEVRFQNESKSSGTKSEPPEAPKEKTSPYKSNPGFSKALFLSLLILLLLLAISFFIAFIIFFQKYSQLLKEKKTVKEFTHTSLDCMKENLTMEGNFIVQQLNTSFSYFLRLSDTQRNDNWQWIDQTPYMENVSSLHLMTEPRGLQSSG